MTTSNLLCLLCGALISTACFLGLTFRQHILDERLIRHVRRSAYVRGWKDGNESAYRREA